MSKGGKIEEDDPRFPAWAVLLNDFPVGHSEQDGIRDQINTENYFILRFFRMRISCDGPGVTFRT